MSSRGRGGEKTTLASHQRSYRFEGINFILNGSVNWRPCGARDMTLIEREAWPEGLTIELCKRAKGIKQKKPKISLYKVKDALHNDVYWIKCNEILNVKYTGVNPIRIRYGDVPDGVMCSKSYMLGLLGTSCAVSNVDTNTTFIETSTGEYVQINTGAELIRCLDTHYSHLLEPPK